MSRLALLCTCLAACSQGVTPDQRIANQGYQVREDCTSTTTCGGSAPTVQSYSYVVGDSADSSSDSDLPPSDDGCDTTITCTPTCEDTAGDDVCSDSAPPAEGGCWVTGGGFIVDTDGHDSFGGNAMPMKSGATRGQWEHQDHGTMAKAHGSVEYIVCRHVDEPGPGQPSGPDKKFNLNQAYFGGNARWFSNGAWDDGYWFDVVVKDHGEPGNKLGPGKHNSAGPDTYHFTLRQVTGANQSGPVVYETAGDLVGGNLQLHPSNNGHPFNGGTLPSWVGFEP